MKKIKQYGLFVIINLIIIVLIVFLKAYIGGLSYKLSTPCFLHEIFHLYCPGCGGTRAVSSLLRFRVVDSLLCNPMVIYFAALIVYFYIGVLYTAIRNNGRRYYKIYDWMLWTMIVLLIGLFVIRNLLLVIFGIDYLGDLKTFW